MPPNSSSLMATFCAGTYKHVIRSLFSWRNVSTSSLKHMKQLGTRLFLQLFQMCTSNSVAHVRGRCEVVHLHLPSLSDLAALSPSSSPSCPRNSIPLLQGLYQHYAHADC